MPSMRSAGQEPRRQDDRAIQPLARRR